MQFRPYQTEIIQSGTEQINSKGWTYLAMEVRTGKTLTSLGIAHNIGGRVVFVTKKKAIGSIQNDVELLASERIDVEVINYESVHKIDQPQTVDVWILDEAHVMGSFPKPSKRAKTMRKMVTTGAVIFLSGTPSPETTSQLFHQMWVLGERSPFFKYRNFYGWARKYCDIYEIHYSQFPVKKYDRCRLNINDLGLITYSQSQAGFDNVIREHFLEVEMSDTVKNLINKIRNDKVVMGETEHIVADTPVKEMSKIHQLSSGTIKFESGNHALLDSSKAEFIKRRFKGKKYAIFYKFKAELELLKEWLDVTEDVEKFNQTDKVLCLQFVSGREGIKLSKADCLVYFNIDFSATTYWQSRDRMTTINRKVSDIYYIVSDCGIEREVYKAVSKKKSYTTRYYEGARLPA